MKPVLTIAAASITEHSRRRLIVFFGGFSVLVTLVLIYFAAHSAGDVFFGDRRNVGFIVSLSGFQFFALLAALAVSMGNIGSPFETKEALPLLARPIYRWQFALGRYLGSVAFIAMLCVLLAVETEAVNIAGGGGVRLALAQHWGIEMVNLTVISALATLLSVGISTPIITAVVAFFVWQGVGVVDLVHRISSSFPKEMAPIKALFKVLWLATPKFLTSNLTLRQASSLGGGRSGGLLPEPDTFGLWIWALAWLFALVAASLILTSRKEI